MVMLRVSKEPLLAEPLWDADKDPYKVLCKGRSIRNLMLMQIASIKGLFDTRAVHCLYLMTGRHMSVP
jgi:hypothetical protein